MPAYIYQVDPATLEMKHGKPEKEERKSHNLSPGHLLKLFLVSPALTDRRLWTWIWDALEVSPEKLSNVCMQKWRLGKCL